MRSRLFTINPWFGDFYPDDLPEDWQLSFYSNEFRAVVVPSAEFANIDPVEVERWVEDVSGEFAFYLEVEDLFTDWAQFARAIAPLGERLKGILFRPIKVDQDLAMIASSLDAAQALAPVCLLLPEGLEPSDSGRDLLSQHGVELCWDTHEGEPAWRGGGFVVARVVGNNHYTPRQWRETIEACLRCSNKSGEDRNVLLMLEHDAPDPDVLRAAVMIGDMLVIPDI